MLLSYIKPNYHFSLRVWRIPGNINEFSQSEEFMVSNTEIKMKTFNFNEHNYYKSNLPGERKSRNCDSSRVKGQALD